jgi:hypothetical protein
VSGPQTPRRAVVVSAGDALPTQQALARARKAALRACAEHIADHCWPPGPLAHQAVDWAALVALEGLSLALPEVSRMTLARCLRLDPHTAPARLDICRAMPAWPAGAVGKVTAAQGRMA